MKPTERIHLALEPFLPPLNKMVRQRLLAIAGTTDHPVILDVGGRRSPYTVAVPGRIILTDLPRTSDTQFQLGLGLTMSDMHRLRSRRSNIAHIVFDNMTCSALRDGVFDCVVAVEVLEHVEDDHRFVREVQRVLRPGGTFLLTTPNGDWVENTNPDHKRHYTRDGLRDLLAESFETVSVEYAIRDSKARTLGLRSFSVRRPVRTLITMGCNALSTWESARVQLTTRSIGTRHLIATARRAGGPH